MGSQSETVSKRVLFVNKLFSGIWAWAVLITGLFLFAESIVLMVKAQMGLGPWDIFHIGVVRVSGLPLGQVSIVTGLAIIIVAFVATREKPGAGTIANMVLIGLFVDWTYGYVPAMTEFPLQFAMFVGGMVLMGLASAVYIGAGLGAGPRDSLMLGLSRATGMSIRLTRTIIEAAVFVIGFFLGGAFGLGTVLFVIGIGPVVQFFMTLLRVKKTH